MWRTIAGTALGFKAVIVFIKCDIKETCVSLGMPSCGTNECPCVICRCTRANWGDIAALSTDAHEWPRHSRDVWDANAANCEVTVELDEGGYSRVRSALQFDVRPHGNRGRCLAANVDELNLRKGGPLRTNP